MSTPYGPPPGERPQQQWPHQPYPTQHFPPPPQPSPPGRRPRRWPVIAAATAAVTLMATAAAIGLSSSETTTPTSTAGGQTTTSAPAVTVAPALLPLPDVQGMTGVDAATALAAAGFSNTTFEQNGAPPSAKVISQTPEPGTDQPTDTLIYLVAEVPPPEPHREVSPRDWQLIAKTPDTHIGQRITVYGHVFQFDSATGPAGFLARVDAVRHDQSYEYDTNTALVGTAQMLGNVVEEDMFRADVTVLGSYSYSTQIGGSTTVPRLQVDAITVIN